jgi:hypothetical protein
LFAVVYLVVVVQVMNEREIRDKTAAARLVKMVRPPLQGLLLPPPPQSPQSLQPQPLPPTTSYKPQLTLILSPAAVAQQGW